MSTSRHTIYVVDDNPAVRRAISRLLSAEGFVVDRCESARQFLLKKLPDEPGCVVLDVSMPGMDGMALQEAMTERGIDLPIIFLTGHGDIPMSVRAMKHGAVDFLTKPVDGPALVEAAHRAIARAQDLRRGRRDADELARRAADLTPRERQVMDLVVTGMLNKQVAIELGTVEKTIKVHRARVMQKMKAESLADLVRMAQRLADSTPNASGR